MKWLIPVIMLAALVAGCKDKPKNPVQQYGDAIIKTIDTSKGVAGAAQLAAARGAINRYKTMNGRYPASMDELREMMDYKFKPEAFDYDPTTGRITPR